MQLYEKYKSLFARFEVDTSLRVAHFMAQIEAESGLRPKRESLYYTTVAGLRANFYSPFKDKTDSFVKSYLRNSEHCANYVYANRGGNGDPSTGDGYKYRGGGLIQRTFKDGYARLSAVTGVDFVANPDLIVEEANAVMDALVFWQDNRLNRYADADDLDAVSDQINIGRQTLKEGDANGYAHRAECLKKWKQILKI